jgi:hypothetical protein
MSDLLCGMIQLAHRAAGVLGFTLSVHFIVEKDDGAST